MWKGFLYFWGGDKQILGKGGKDSAWKLEGRPLRFILKKLRG